MSIGANELNNFDLTELTALEWRLRWQSIAHDFQKIPDGDWTEWLQLAGRGAGKTRGCAEQVSQWAWDQPNTRWLVAAPTKSDLRSVCFEGEALALDTPIRTPIGWRQFGDLAEGDFVFDETGSPTKVVAVSEVWENRPCYSLLTCGAEPIIADARHKWVTQTTNDRAADYGYRTRSTEELANAPNGVWHRLPDAGPIKLPHAKLPIPPYTLGAWLGDGDTRGHGTLTCHDKDVQIVDRIRADGFIVKKRVGSYAWGIIGGLRVALRGAGLAGNKRIPVSYMGASINQRLELLRGLMDTDGYVSVVGQCAFDNTNCELVVSVRELLISLGYKAGAIQVKTSKKGFKTIYRITFRLSPQNPIPFNLQRKIFRCIKSKRQIGRVFRSVVAVKSVPVKCIQVCNPSGLFLVGRDMIVTHNSGLLNVIPPSLIKPNATGGLWNSSLAEIELINGSLLKGISADEPERFRGPQFHGGWIDEICAWSDPEGAYEMIEYTMRLGLHPRLLISTTPKPTPFIKTLVKKQGHGLAITTASTYVNEKNLAPSFLAKLKEKEGTSLGRQEIHAEILDSEESGIIKRKNIRLWPCDNPLPKFEYIAVSFDTAFTELDFNKKKQTSDPTACTIWGVFYHEKRKRMCIMLLEAWEEHIGFDDLRIRALAESKSEWGVISHAYVGGKRVTRGRRPDIMIIEAKGSGISLSQSMEREGVLVHRYDPGMQSKLTRLHLVSHLFTNGVIYIMESRRNVGKPVNWADSLITQICSYIGPGSTAHDDWVDSTTQALLLLISQLGITVVTKKELMETEEDTEKTAEEPVINPYAV